jgi:hypothetical protein
MCPIDPGFKAVARKSGCRSRSTSCGCVGIGWARRLTAIVSDEAGHITIRRPGAIHGLRPVGAYDQGPVMKLDA